MAELRPSARLLGPALLAAALLAPFLAASADAAAPRVIELTAVSKDAVWTQEEVTQSTYWQRPEPARAGAAFARRFAPATLVLRQAEQVLVRLHAYDNEHGFYIPDLGIGPFEIKKGEIKEFILDASRHPPGAYLYLCTKTKCSDRHHWMRGYVVIYPESGRFESPPALVDWAGERVFPTLPQLVQVPAGPSLERGHALFTTKGCIACHNRGGRGGIVNHNYISGTVPKLNNRGELMMLFETADALKVIDVLAKGRDLTLPLLEALGVPRPGTTFSQYQSMLALLRAGKPDEGKKDPRGPAPALLMPEWKDELSREDMNAVLAYLLSISEYDDGTIAEPPEPIPEIFAPAEHAAALARFEQRPEARPAATGDTIVQLVALADAVIALAVVGYWIRRRKHSGPAAREARG